MLRQRVPNILASEAFDVIENKLQILNDNDTLCALVGDFIARSSDLKDFIIPDDDL